MVWGTAHIRVFLFECLDEIEKEFENALAFLSGAQMGSNQEKNSGKISCDTLPLILMNGKRAARTLGQKFPPLHIQYMHIDMALSQLTPHIRLKHD